MPLSLRDVLTPLFLCVLRITRTLDGQQAEGGQGGFTIRDRITGLLKEQDALATQQQLSEQAHDDARFAVIAWIDECMLRYAQGEADARPLSTWDPLQVELYEGYWAGEEFFRRLERWLSKSPCGPQGHTDSEQREVCEIYHLCISLGFRGKYQENEKDPDFLDLRHRLAHSLPVSFPTLDPPGEPERVTDQPYNVPEPLPLRQRDWFLWAGSGLAVLLIMFLVWCPPTPARVSKQLAPFPCADLEVAEVSWAGRVLLKGRVSSADQRERVVSAVRGLRGVTDVQQTLEVIPKPFCQVLDSIDPFRQQDNASGLGLAVQPTKGCQGLYSDEEELMFTVTSQVPLHHYVYVDVYWANQTHVGHILPNRLAAANSFEGEQELTLGLDPNSWQIQAPFGLELVTVIVSPKPFFEEEELTDGEPISEYLPKLRHTLATAEDGVVTASCFFRSNERMEGDE